MKHKKIAATRMDIGTDVNYGAITTQLVDHLNKNQNFKLSTQSEVTGVSRNDDNTWTVSVKNLKDGTTTHTKTRHVSIGAGGAVIKLLQMTDLPESKYYAGFPVGGLYFKNTTKKPNGKIGQKPKAVSVFRSSELPQVKKPSYSSLPSHSSHKMPL